MDYFLAVDLGGTHTNMAILTKKDNVFTIISQKNHSSSRIIDFTMTLKEFVRESHFSIGAGSVCAAGPIINDICDLTNLPFTVNSKELEKALGFPVYLINDFSAICHGVELVQDNYSLTPQIETDHDGIGLVIGPGTGLGTGFFCSERVFPAEGGHMCLPVWNKESAEILESIQSSMNLSSVPGAETIVSGHGIARLYNYYYNKISGDEYADSINNLDPHDQIPLISQSPKSSEVCTRTMDMFIEYFARFAQNVALQFLPKRGLFLAGGVSNKIIGHIKRDNQFIKYFHNNYKSNISAILKTIPLFIVRDYSVSLYGAAQAAYLRSIRS